MLMMKASNHMSTSKQHQAPTNTTQPYPLQLHQVPTGLGRFSSQSVGLDVSLGDEDILPRVATDATDGMLRCREALALGLPAQGAQGETVLAAFQRFTNDLAVLYSDAVH